jgi:hypothetical protein
MVTTLRPMPQLPTITSRLRLLESAWPTVTPNTWWLVPPLHLQPLYLLCWGVSCLTSPIPSLAWACLPTKTAQLSLHEPQSQSTTQTAIQSSQAGRMRLVCISGIFLSPPRPLTSRMQPVPKLLGCPSQILLCFLLHQPCLQQPTPILARASWPPTHLRSPAWSTTCTAQPRLLPWLPGLQIPHLTHAALISPALVPWLVSIVPAWAFLSSKRGLTPSKPATETPLIASPTPMQPGTVWMLM